MPLPLSSIGLSADGFGESKDLAAPVAPAAAPVVAKSDDAQVGDRAGSEPAPAAAVWAIVPFRSSGKGKGAGKGALTPFRKKLFRELGEKPIEESIEELRASVQSADAREEAAAALVAEKDASLQEAQAEFDAVNAEVVVAIAQEVEAANTWQSLRTRLEQQREAANGRRVALLEAQQRLAMLEVMATNQRQMQAFEEQRRAAVAAAEEAKRQLQEHKRSSMKASLERLAPFRGPKRARAAEAEAEAGAEAEGQEAEPEPQQVTSASAASTVQEADAEAKEEQVTSPPATEVVAQEEEAPPQEEAAAPRPAED